MDLDYDVDYAIALSLSEPQPSPPKPPCHNYEDDFRLAQQLQDEDMARQLSSTDRHRTPRDEAQVKSDEELAKKLQELPQPTPPESSSSIFQALGKFLPSMAEKDSILCSHCLRPIASTERRVRPQKGVEYHAACFTCSICHQPISGSYTFDASTGQPQHTTCRPQRSQSACIVCGKCFAPGETYLRSGSFPDRGGFCTIHADVTPYCYVCKAYEPSIPGKEKFQSLSDGRKQCSECLSCGIYDSAEAAALYQQVLAFFVSHLNFRLPERMRQVPILCVDASALQENNTHAGGCHTGTSVRGLTLSTYQTINYFTSGVRHVFAPTALQHTDRDVTAVLILYGMPRHLAMSVMAHEAMHVYIRLNSTIPLHLPSQVEEGICQLVAYLYLQFIRRTESSSESSAWEKQLLPYFLQEIETDTSVVYGDGFRAAKKCCDELGLDVLLEYVRDNAAFPM